VYKEFNGWEDGDIVGGTDWKCPIPANQNESLDEADMSSWS
jgi:hypothetical protein